MDYNKLTKAQLIEKIKQLETQTLQYKFENFVIESQLLMEDLYKAIEYVYCLGAKSYKAVEKFEWSVMKQANVVRPLEVNTIETEFNF